MAAEEPGVGAVCTRCGAAKDLPLARCGGCGASPAGDDAVLAVLASRRVLDAEGLAAAAARIRAGEPLRPSARLLDRAREILAGRGPGPEAAPPPRLARREVALLVVGNVLLTPVLGMAAWWRLRERPGPAARQALWATVPVVLLGAALWLYLWARPG